MHYSNYFLFFFLFFFSTPDDPSEDHNIIEDLSVLLLALNDPQFQSALEAPQVSPCNCKRNNGQPCHTFFDDVEVSRCRLQYIGKTRQLLDLVLLAKIELCAYECGNSETEIKAESERKADIYRHKGFEICRNFFLHLHSIGEKKLKIYSSKIKKMELKVGFTNQQKNNHHMLFLLKMSNLPSILFKILLKLMRLSCQAAHRMLGSLIANFCLLNVLVILCMGSMQRLWMNVDKRRYL